MSRPTGGEDGAKEALEVLLNESEQTNQSIQRNISAVSSSFGVILPAAVALFVFLGDPQNEPRVVIVSFAFVAVIALLCLHLNNLWLDTFILLRYKYGELHPELYRRAGVAGVENLGQFMFRSKEAPDRFPIAAINAILPIVLGGVLIYGTWRPADPLSLVLTLAGAALIGVCATSGFMTLKRARVMELAIAASAASRRRASANREKGASE